MGLTSVFDSVDADAYIGIKDDEPGRRRLASHARSVGAASVTIQAWIVVGDADAEVGDTSLVVDGDDLRSAC